MFCLFEQLSDTKLVLFLIHQNSSLQMVLCRVADVQKWSFGGDEAHSESVCSPMLGGMGFVANFEMIYGYKNTQKLLCRYWAHSISRSED